jgi:hypothetical protein
MKKLIILFLPILLITTLFSCGGDNKEKESSESVKKECDCQEITLSKGKFIKSNDDKNLLGYTGECVKKNQDGKILIKSTFKDGWKTEEVEFIPYKNRLIEVRNLKYKDNKISSGFVIGEISTSELLPYDYVKEYIEYSEGEDSYSYDIDLVEYTKEIELPDGGYETVDGDELVYTTYSKGGHPKSTSGVGWSDAGIDNPCYGTGVILDDEQNKSEVVKGFFECFIKTEKPKHFFFEKR